MSLGCINRKLVQSWTTTNWCAESNDQTVVSHRVKTKMTRAIFWRSCFFLICTYVKSKEGRNKHDGEKYLHSFTATTSRSSIFFMWRTILLWPERMLSKLYKTRRISRNLCRSKLRRRSETPHFRVIEIHNRQIWKMRQNASSVIFRNT